MEEGRVKTLIISVERGVLLFLTYLTPKLRSKIQN